MTVVLATTWRPQGELPRMQSVYTALLDAYDGLVIIFPPDAEPTQVDEFKSLGIMDQAQIHVQFSPDWSWGRYLALKEALQFPGTHVHYADMDRLLRWVETRPEEWLDIVRHIPESDCLIMGRSKGAYGTHPQALMQTEAISNMVVSFLVDKRMDVSAGSKAFSRRAAEYIVANCSPGKALGTDAEWPVTLHRAGFVIDYVEVDGLDWESADRYKIRSADPTEQKEAAVAYDANPQSWARRIDIALEIVEVGIRTIGQGVDIKDGD